MEVLRNYIKERCMQNTSNVESWCCDRAMCAKCSWARRKTSASSLGAVQRSTIQPSVILVDFLREILVVVI